MKSLSDTDRHELTRRVLAVVNPDLILLSEVTKILAVVEHFLDEKISFSEKIKKGSIADSEFHPNGPEVTSIEQKKMTKQRLKVFDLMKDGQWRTLDAIAASGISSPPQSIAIYLRSFREEQYGGYTVNIRKLPKSRIFEYQLLFQ